MLLRTRPHAWRFLRRRPLMMGIVNANPDSVADLERPRGIAERVALAQGLVDAGADVIDVGGESGRTDPPASSPDEAARRVLPLIHALSRRGIATSLDTLRVRVAAAAIGAGTALINDVSGLRDPRRAELTARHGTGLVIMHTRAAPKEEHFPGYGDPIGDIMTFPHERIALAEQAAPAPSGASCEREASEAHDGRKNRRRHDAYLKWNDLIWRWSDGRRIGMGGSVTAGGATAAGTAGRVTTYAEQHIPITVAGLHGPLGVASLVLVLVNRALIAG